MVKMPADINSSFFWSPEFVGGVASCKKLKTRYEIGRRIAFTLLLLLLGTIAALVGPASAILMIPGVVDWPVGGMVYWLNGQPQTRVGEAVPM